MPSPSKKRKLNSDSAPPSRGLAYFFAKQAQNSSRSTPPSTHSGSAHAEDAEGALTDEELAKKLQAEWDAEVRGLSAQTTPKPEEAAAASDAQTQPPEPALQPPPVQVSPPTPVGQPAKPKNTLSLSSASATDDEIASSIPLDESVLAFDPAKYIPQLQESWASEDGAASYALLTRCFVLVNGTQSRIKIVDTLVNCIRLLIEGDPSSLLPAVWLATNAISPPYISMELGLGGSAISKALKQACGLDNRALKELYNKVGDAGDVAFEAKKKQSFTFRKPKPLTIQGVFQSLVKIAKAQGQGSGDVKQRIVDRLLQDARGGEESRYIVRTLCQHLRIGAVKTTMLIALSRAFLLSKPPGADYPTKDARDLAKLKKEELAEVWARGEGLVKASFARHPDYNDLVPVLLEVGISDELLVRCGLTLHIPLSPMLGSIARDIPEMLTKLEGRDFTCEYKYDGQRAQVHCDSSGKVSIFSRHLELMTDKYPDLVALVPKIRGDGVESFIMEGEVVAVDRASGELKNFQTLTNRARKDVAIGSITIDVCLFAFDLMYLNGESLLHEPLRRRRDLLRSLFVEKPHHFTWVKSLDATSQDSEAVLEFFKSALDVKCEGIMVKTLDNPASLDDPSNQDTKPPQPSSKPSKPRHKPLQSTYTPSVRHESWLKLKKDYTTHASETLDLVPIAAWHGQGRKAKWWSPILLAVRNPDTGSLEAVCKCMSGFSDAFYAANRAFYDPETGENTHARQPGWVECGVGLVPQPDVWFEAREVWEVAFADVTVSPTYTAGMGLAREDRGLSLRFPRFLRVREDKGVDEASTGEYLAALWRKQEAKGPGVGGEVVKGGEGEQGEEVEAEEETEGQLEDGVDGEV